MCGIAGVARRNSTATGENRVKQMLSVLSHRGPDDEGMWTDEYVCLGHRRLSIIDVSSAGHQPMVFENLVIVFNGEVYNYLELKKELSDLGHVFKTSTDTEVILHSFAEWGKRALEKFNGMWALALYDSGSHTLFCVRDRFGIKPFYYAWNDHSFIFASEIKALLEAGVPPRANLDILLDYLVIGLGDHTEKTFFSEVYQLPPGYSLELSLEDFSMKMERYYDLAVNIPEAPSKAADYAFVLMSSVDAHLRSDVPVGTCLSGGIDSSTVAAIAARAIKAKTGGKFAAVTARSECREKDETGYARLVVDHCDLEWHCCMPTYEDFDHHVERCLWFQDEPVLSPSVFMQFWVMKTASEAGLKVMLDGQGGDEILLGYERYYPFFFLDLLKRGKIGTLIGEYISASRNSKLNFRSLSGYTAYFLLPLLRKRVLKSRYSFLKKDYLDRTLGRSLRDATEGIGDMLSLQQSEIMRLNLPQLLHYEDRNSMAHSVEARVPFIEHVGIETALSLAPEDKIRHGYTKFVLRKAAETLLPSEIAWRKNKVGFEAPDKIWLDKHLDKMKAAVLGSRILRTICGATPDLRIHSIAVQWKLYNIAVWEKQFHVTA